MIVLSLMLALAVVILGSGLWFVHLRLQARRDNKRLSEISGMLMDCSSQAMFKANADGRCVYVNDLATELLGYSKETFLTMTIGMLVAPEDPARQPLRLDELGRGNSLIVQHPLIHKDGRWILCEISVRQMPDRTFLGIVRDVTARKQGNDILRKNEERYRVLLEHGLDLITITDADGKVTYQSPSVPAIMGFQPDEFVGRNLREFVPPENVSIFDDFLKEVRRTPGKVHHTIGKAVRKDGRIIVIEGSVRNLLDTAGVFGIVFNGRDVTKRLVAEKRLLRLAGDQVAVFNVLPAQVCMTDMNGAVLSINHIARHYFTGAGITGPVTGQNYFELIQRARFVSEQDLEIFREDVRRIAAGESSQFDTVVCHEVSQTKRWFQVHVTLVDASTPCILIMHHDITERKQSEERLLHQERMLRNVFESEPECVKLIDREGIIVDMNAAGLAMLEASSVDDVRGKPFLAFVPASFHAYLKDALSDGFGGKKIHLEFDAIGLNGTRRRMESTCVPLRNELGDVDRLLSVTRDVTEHRHAIAALQLSEERFRRVFETAGDVVFTCTFDGSIDSLNPAFEEILGLSREEWIGKKFFDIVHADDTDQAVAVFMQCLKGEQPPRFEVRVRHRTGSYRVGELRIAPIMVADKVSGIVGIGRDVTDRKEQERQLRESEERYRNLFEEELTGKFVSMPSGRIIACNSAFARMFGFANPEAVLSHDMASLHKSPDDHVRFLNLLRENGALYHHENERRGIDGRTIQVIENVIGKFDAAGQLIQLLGSLLDVTDYRVAERRILDQARYLDQAQDGIVVTNMSRQIIYWNKSARRLFGWSAEEVLGSDIEHLLFSSRREAINHVYREVLTRDDVEEEWEIAAKDGTKSVFQSRWSVVRDDLGVSKSVISIHSDITEKKNIESQFLRAQRLESVGVLASGIAHDLNNILSAVGLAAHLLKKRYETNGAADLIQTVETSVQRGADIVKQVLLFTRGTDGEKRPLAASEMIGEMEAIMKQTFPKSIELCTKIDPDLWTVYGDRTQLHQVLMNLCVNARDAMPDGGTLLLSAYNNYVDEAYARMIVDARVGQFVTIDIRDTGMGMSPEVLDRMYDPFFTTKELGKGTGLGLSTVLGIVKSHGGFIRVYSELRKGTRFSINFPINEERQTERVVSKVVDLRGRGETILLVDDEKAVRQVAQIALEESGYLVLGAENGADAIAILADHKADVKAVVLDMMMPVMDGWVTSMAIGKMDPNLPILATSGLQDRLNEQRSENIIELIEKPYSAEKLLESLRRVLDKREAAVA